MKKIFYLLIASMVILNFGCKPKSEDSPGIGDPPTGDFTITDTDDYNKSFSVTNSTGFLVNWDFGNGNTAVGETAVLYFPFKNNYTVSCTITGKGGTITITKSVNIAVTDPAVAELPVIKELTDTGVGRTWVYAIDANADRTGSSPANGFCYMVANYDWDEFWWDPYEYPAGSPPGIDNEMKFDLDGAPNYTFYESAGSPGVVGSFLVNAVDMTITFTDARIPDYDEENCNPDVTETNVYEIYSVTDDELILYQDQGDDFGYGWVWVFKRKGYVYP